ncbi:MAG: response regulator [Myxococcota bacterium]
MGKVALLVDDSPTTRVQFARALKQYGLEVVTADSAEAALELLESGLEADLLISDQYMEGATGTELAQRARALPAFGNRPIVIMTATVSSEFVEQARAARASGFMRKPISQGQLQSLLDSLLGAA